MKYYYSINNETIGPVDKNDLASIITRDTLIWHKGLEQWTKASDVPDLFPLFIEVPPPLPVEKQKKEKTILDIRVTKEDTQILTQAREEAFANELKQNFILSIIALLISITFYFGYYESKNGEINKLLMGFKAYESALNEQLKRKNENFLQDPILSQRADSLYQHWVLKNESRLQEYFLISKSLNLLVGNHIAENIPDRKETIRKIERKISYNNDDALEFGVSVFIISLSTLVIGRYIVKSVKWVDKRTTKL